jgi:hypothetical protein
MARTTPNLGLTVWNLGTDFFNHGALASDWDALDAHDHSPGKGALVPTAGLANLSVTTAKIADSSVTTPKLADANVTTAKIADAAITAAKLLDGAVTSAKFAPTIDLTTTALSANASGSSYADACSLTFTPSRAGRSLFLAVVQGGLSMPTSGGAIVTMKLKVDGVDQSFIPQVTSQTTGSLTYTFPWGIVGAWIPTLTATAHTVKTQVQAANSVGAASASFDSAFLMRIELGS